jgi:hypothetical protein
MMTPSNMRPHSLPTYMPRLQEFRTIGPSCLCSQYPLDAQVARPHAPHLQPLLPHRPCAAWCCLPQHPLIASYRMLCPFVVRHGIREIVRSSGTTACNASVDNEWQFPGNHITTRLVPFTLSPNFTILCKATYPSPTTTQRRRAWPMPSPISVKSFMTVPSSWISFVGWTSAYSTWLHVHRSQTAMALPYVHWGALQAALIATNSKGLLYTKWAPTGEPPTGYQSSGKQSSLQPGVGCQRRHGNYSSNSRLAQWPSFYSPRLGLSRCGPIQDT